MKQGEWDSIHVVEVRNDGPSKAVYKLTTTVMLNMNVEKNEVGETSLSGSLTRQVWGDVFLTTAITCVLKLFLLFYL